MTEPEQGKAKKTFYASEIGLIEIVGDERGILSVQFMDDPLEKRPVERGKIPKGKSAGNSAKTCENLIPTCLQGCWQQLDEYFCGKRKSFSLPLLLEGTDFQRQVWNRLTEIPYGKTISYQAVAEGINNPKAVRAVGQANNRNPIAILVPCHRVIGKNGGLTGYGGGLWRKEWLLAHEGNNRL